MAGHMSRSSAETSGNSYDQQQLQTNKEFVMAFLDLHNDVMNNKRLLEFVDNYYINTPDFCAPLQQSLIHSNNRVIDPLILHHFLHNLSRLYKQQLMMRVTLQFLDSSAGERLQRIHTSKKVSAVFFTSAATASAAVAAANANTKNPAVASAAAAASILLGAVGKWVVSLLRERESAVKRHKEIVAVMIVGAKISMKDLSSIYSLASRLQLETELSLVKKSFEELGGKANDYNRNLKWTRKVVIHTIIKHVN